MPERLPSGDGLLGSLLNAMQVVGGALRVSGSLENRALVVAKNGQPVLDICGGLPGFGRQLKGGAREGGAEFGDEFFGCVTFIAEALAPEVAIEPLRVPRPVRAFMGERRVVRLGIAERFEGRGICTKSCVMV